MKYLPLYYKWMKAGELPNNGLCHSLPDSTLLSLFSPTGYLLRDDSWYWGYDGTVAEFHQELSVLTRRAYDLSPLRENIILFMAAMNNEL